MLYYVLSVLWMTSYLHIIDAVKAFPVAASLFWNSLPSDIRSSPSLPIFRQRLKTFLFRQSFPDVVL